MHGRTGFVAALMLLALGSPATAQRAGAVELGAFGRFTKFENKLNFDDRFGVGGRLGVFVLQNLAVEGDVLYVRTKSETGLELRHTPIHARLIYHVPFADNTAFLVGAGYVRNIFRANYRETNDGVGALLGIRFPLSSMLGLRVDVTGDYIPTAETDSRIPQVPGVEHKKSNVHLGAQAGLSLLLNNGKRDGDSDRDGVLNSVDACPATPIGDAVDARGCSLPKDADKDGVTDNLDRCPGTPAGDRVDANGCSLPKDADGDGVVDANDKCPNTPAGTEVDATGCPKEKDSDRDGVFDLSDLCPGTPAGSKVDRFGCILDSDGDGVADGRDQCPATVAGMTVDAKGCPSIFQEGQPLVLVGVNFETGKAVLLPESRDILDQVAQSLVDNPEVNVEVGGHTDNVGTAASNQRLSQARADAVRSYLLAKGVDGARMTAVGYGEEKPTADNTTPAGRFANRRVELNRTN